MPECLQFFYSHKQATSNPFQEATLQTEPYITYREFSGCDILGIYVGTLGINIGLVLSKHIGTSVASATCDDILTAHNYTHGIVLIIKICGQRKQTRIESIV